MLPGPELHSSSTTRDPNSTRHHTRQRTGDAPAGRPTEGDRLRRTRYGTTSGNRLYSSAQWARTGARSRRQGWNVNPPGHATARQIAYTSYPTATPTSSSSNADRQPTRSHPSPPTPRNTKPAWSSTGIAFASNRGGRDEIYLMQPNGTNMRKCSPTASKTRPPTVTWTAPLVRQPPRLHQRHRSSKPKTRNLRALTHVKWFRHRPAWSPRGNEHTPSRDVTIGHSDLYLAHPAPHHKQAHHWPASAGHPPLVPRRPPDPFPHFESFGAQIWLINANGRPHPLTSNGPWNDQTPLVTQTAPIGVLERQNGTDTLYIFDPATTAHTDSPRPQNREVHAAWSPDGKLSPIRAPQAARSTTSTSSDPGNRQTPTHKQLRQQQHPAGRPTQQPSLTNRRPPSLAMHRPHHQPRRPTGHQIRTTTGPHSHPAGQANPLNRSVTASRHLLELPAWVTGERSARLGVQQSPVKYRPAKRHTSPFAGKYDTVAQGGNRAGCR